MGKGLRSNRKKAVRTLRRRVPMMPQPPSSPPPGTRRDPARGFSILRSAAAAHRNEVATSKLYQDREAAIQARLQTTLEAGRAARQLVRGLAIISALRQAGPLPTDGALPLQADQMRAAQPGEAPSGKEEAMDVDAAPRPMQKLRGIPLTKKKALKLKKLGGKRGGKQAVQSVFKRKGKGKKHKGS